MVSLREFRNNKKTMPPDEFVTWRDNQIQHEFFANKRWMPCILLSDPCKSNYEKCYVVTPNGLQVKIKKDQVREIKEEP